MGFSNGIGSRELRDNPAIATSRLSGKRTVFPSAEIPHLWAHGLAEGRKVRNQTGSIFAEGDTIYSYGLHFPMAKRVTLRSGAVAYLVNPNSHRVTTSGHQSAVRGAIPGYRAYGEDGRNVYHVPPMDARWNGNRGGWSSTPDLWDDLTNRGGRAVAAYYQSLIVQAAADATTARRVQAKTRAAALDRIPGIVASWRELHKVFGLRCSVGLVKAPDTLDLQAARGIVAKQRASIDRANKAERERDAERERAAALEQAERTARAERIALPQWRAGGAERVYLSAAGTVQAEWSEGCTTVRISDLGYPALRVVSRDKLDPREGLGEGSLVESSHGAVVPLDAVRALLRVLPSDPDTLTEPKTIAASVGDYGPVVVSRESVRVGCHVFPWSEVRTFAAYLPG